MDATELNRRTNVVRAATQRLTELIDGILHAAKYSEPDTLIEIRVFRERRMLSCSVTDQGRGISPIDLKRAGAQEDQN